MTSPLPADEPLFAALLGAELRSVSWFFGHHDPLARSEPDENDVHHARTALRRSRSYLRTFAALFPRGYAADVRVALRWYGTELSPLRDLDVIGVEIARLAATTAPAEVDAAQGLVAHQRASELTRLRGLALDDRYLRAATDMRELADPGLHEDLRGPDDGELVQLLRRPYRDLRAAWHAWEAKGGDRRVHELRIRSKELRYAAELCRPVFGEPAWRLAEGAEKVQDRIGDARNARLVRDLLRGALARPHDRALDGRELLRQARELDRLDEKKLRRDLKAIRRSWRDLHTGSPATA